MVGRTLQVFDPGIGPRGVNHPWLALIFLLVVVAAVGVLIWALLRSPRQAYPLPPTGQRIDPAMEALRMRFARGEIDADEYRARAAHLSGWIPHADQPLPGSPSS
jgi:putative membrane protein